MVTGEVSIRQANIVIKPMRHRIMLHLSYPVVIEFPVFGERKATLGPIGKNSSLWLRTEFEERNFSGRLTTLLKRKTDWDGIRRRVVAQIGRCKGGARAKRRKLAQLTWEGWLENWLHQWSREIIDWLKSQGIGNLSVIGLESADWPAFRFTKLLRDKGELAGITVHTEADLATPATARAVKTEIQRQRRRATKAGKALRELGYQIGDARRTEGRRE
jgi:hypothetical protein